jgi:aspartate dehydrogenase
MSGFEKICLIGWGAISQRVASLLRDRNSRVEIVAVAVRDLSSARPNLPRGAKLIGSADELAASGASLAVEAAGRSSVLCYGRAALQAGMDFAVSSTSAFVEEGTLSELTALAVASDCKLLVSSGALGGIDALAAASRLEVSAVDHRIVKPPIAWRGTPAETLCDLNQLAEAFTFFEGTAREAADRFPQNANVAVISALAGIGLDRTRISLVADPFTSINRHEVSATGDFGALNVRLENRPLKENPKSSEMTALNIVRLVENRLSGLSI